MKDDLKYLNKTEIHALNRFCEMAHSALGDCIIRMEMFGSKARGDYSVGSDIDILLIVRERTLDIMDKIAEITSELNLEYDLSIAPVVFSEYEYKMNIGMLSPFSLSVEAEGVGL
jgi:predicted nucleotidyltransferase